MDWPFPPLIGLNPSGWQEAIVSCDLDEDWWARHTRLHHLAHKNLCETLYADHNVRAAGLLEDVVDELQVTASLAEDIGSVLQSLTRLMAAFWKPADL